MSNKYLNATGLALLCAMAALATPPVHAAGQDGMVVVRDPQSGQWRAPTAAEAQALRSSSPGAAARSLQQQAPAQPQMTVGKGGSRQVRLGEKGLVYSVVTRAQDGALAEQCVQGQQAADAAVQQSSPDKEPRHEHQ